MCKDSHVMAAQYHHGLFDVVLSTSAASSVAAPANAPPPLDPREVSELQALAGQMLSNDECRKILGAPAPRAIDVLNLSKLPDPMSLAMLDPQLALDLDCLRFLNSAYAAAEAAGRQHFVYVDLTANSFLPTWLKPAVIGGQNNGLLEAPPPAERRNCWITCIRR